MLRQALARASVWAAPFRTSHIWYWMLPHRPSASATSVCQHHPLIRPRRCQFPQNQRRCRRHERAGWRINGDTARRFADGARHRWARAAEPSPEQVIINSSGGSKSWGTRELLVEMKNCKRAVIERIRARLSFRRRSRSVNEPEHSTARSSSRSVSFAEDLATASSPEAALRISRVLDQKLRRGEW